jgi:hypothetical protein
MLLLYGLDYESQASIYKFYCGALYDIILVNWFHTPTSHKQQDVEHDIANFIWAEGFIISILADIENSLVWMM